MRKPKIASFYYKRYVDVYVSNVSFSTDVLLSILDTFLEQNIIILIESDLNHIQNLLSICKNMGIEDIISYFPASRVSIVCKKSELLSLIKQVNIDNIEGMFMASMPNIIISDEIIRTFDHLANSVVKDRIFDVSLSINFLENQIIISMFKEKYKVMSIKEKIYKFFN